MNLTPVQSKLLESIEHLEVLDAVSALTAASSKRHIAVIERELAYSLGIFKLALCLVDLYQAELINPFNDWIDENIIGEHWSATPEAIAFTGRQG